MTNSEPLGRNQAMKIILGQSMIDEYKEIQNSIDSLAKRLEFTKLPVEKLKVIKAELNELVHSIQKELMSAPADSRIHDIGPRSREERTPDPTNREES